MGKLAASCVSNENTPVLRHAPPRDRHATFKNTRLYYRNYIVIRKLEQNRQRREYSPVLIDNTATL